MRVFGVANERCQVLATGSTTLVPRRVMSRWREGA